MTPVGPQILQTTRNLPLETVSLERALPIDTQGRETYDSPVSFEANVVAYDTARGREGFLFQVNSAGSEHRATLTLYIPGDATVVPDEGDRITWGGSKYIAIEKKTVAGLEYTSAEPDHHRIRCRDE